MRSFVNARVIAAEDLFQASLLWPWLQAMESRFECALMLLHKHDVGSMMVSPAS